MNQLNKYQKRRTPPENLKRRLAPDDLVRHNLWIMTVRGRGVNFKIIRTTLETLTGVTMENNEIISCDEPLT